MIDPKRLVTLLLAGAVFLFVVFGMERCEGRHDAEVEAASANTKEMRRLFHVEHTRAQAAEQVALAAVANAKRLAAPAERTIARTDSVGAQLDSATAQAVRLAQDTAATNAQLRGTIVRFAETEGRFRETLRVERDTSAQRLSALLSAQGKLLTAVAAKDVALAAAENAEAAARDLEKKLAGPGIVHRGVTGLVIGSVSATCSVVGYVVAGPLGAVVGLAGCSIASGIFSP